MNDHTFARLVAEDVRNRVSDDEAAYLRLPENWGRWQRALQDVLADLDRQVADLDARSAALDAATDGLDATALHHQVEVRADIASRRNRIARFRFHVESRADQVTVLIANGTDEVEERLDTLAALRDGIEAHRRRTLGEGWEATEADEALWAVLDALTPAAAA